MSAVSCVLCSLLTLIYVGGAGSGKHSVAFMMEIGLIEWPYFKWRIYVDLMLLSCQSSPS